MNYSPAPISDPEETAAQLDLQNKVVIICVNFLILMELCAAMFFAARQPERLAELFCFLFFAMLIPTLLGAKTVKYVLRRASEKESDGR